MQTIIIDRKSGGRISGFPQPHIRANWPSAARGKQLTDRRIEYYRQKGYYGSNGIIALQKEKTIVKAKIKSHRKPKVNELRNLLGDY